MLIGKLLPAYMGVSFVWVTTHFGGGFASGRQIVEYFVSHGWYALFLPLLAVFFKTLIIYYTWSFCVCHRTYDYKSWANRFYQPYEKILSPVFEGLYLTSMLMATAIALATGGASISSLLGTPYILNSLLMALVVFSLAAYSAETIRRFAMAIALVVVSSIIFAFGLNVIEVLPEIGLIVKEKTSTTGILSAGFSMLIYAGFQAVAIGAYIAVADVLKSKREAFKAALVGFIINAIILVFTSLAILGHYPQVLAAEVPTIYVIEHGSNVFAFAGFINVLIAVAVIFPGVNLVFGGVKRVITWWPAGKSKLSKKQKSFIIAGLFIILAWIIALQGLIELVSRGYTLIGSLAIPLIVLPVLFRLVLSKL